MSQIVVTTLCFCDLDAEIVDQNQGGEGHLAVLYMIYQRVVAATTPAHPVPSLAQHHLLYPADETPLQHDCCTDL